MSAFEFVRSLISLSSDIVLSLSALYGVLRHFHFRASYASSARLSDTSTECP